MEGDKVNLTPWQYVRMIGPIVVSIIILIILPLVDVTSDIRLVVKLYIHGHHVFASLLLGNKF